MDITIGRHHTTLTDDDGEEHLLKLDTTPSEVAIVGYAAPIVAAVGDKVVIGYLADDHDCQNPLEDCDGMGHIKTAHRHAGRDEHHAMQEALALDGDWSPDLGLDLVQEDTRRRLNAVILESHAPAFARMVLESGQDGISQDQLMEAMLAYLQGRYVPTVDFSEEDERFLDSLPDWDSMALESWRDLIAQRKIGDPYVVSLDCYEHGLQHWSVSGEGMQCRWDTSRGAGVWIPDGSAREEAHRREGVYAFGKTFESRGPTPWHAVYEDGGQASTTSQGFEQWHEAFEWLSGQVQASGREPTDEQHHVGRMRAGEELAREALNVYNAWLRGDTFGICVDVFERTDNSGYKFVESEAVWGHIGTEYALQELASSVEATVRQLEREARDDPFQMDLFLPPPSAPTVDRPNP